MPQKSFFRDHRLHPSVDFYSASLLYQLGFSLDYFTAVYACACIPGWVAHIHEQVTSGAPVRPDMQYAGRAQRSFVPLEKRV
jgi:citrate synthase